MELTELAGWLVRIGCPPEKSVEMVGQLDRRARQLAESKGKSYEELMAHLLRLMQEGWAAQQHPPGDPSHPFRARPDNA